MVEAKFIEDSITGSKAKFIFNTKVSAHKFTPKINIANGEINNRMVDGINSVVSSRKSMI
jgi:hypothetical protein